VSRVTLAGVGKRYGSVVALETLDLDIQEGEFLTLLGPSGCGKTTTLRLIAGFVDPTTGRILIDGEDVTGLPPQKRSIGMVFQDYALFPHLTIEENIGFGLRERGVARADTRRRVGELLDLVRLSGVERRYPAELSGGQQQRVAVARAVAHPPRVLLMDEPLGALDLKLREAMQLEIRRIQQTLRITTVYVTHDQGEAMTLSDRIAVMSGGRLVQLGTAAEVYGRPCTRFVADFVGKINLLDGRVVGDEGHWWAVEVARTVLRAPRNGAPKEGRVITVGVRPEQLRLLSPEADPGGRNALRGSVIRTSFAGNLVHVAVDVGEGLVVVVELRPGEGRWQVGDTVQVAWERDQALVLFE
jgi:putative spermidine/putrescine transport system ATP-binding protein